MNLSCRIVSALSLIAMCFSLSSCKIEIPSDDNASSDDTSYCSESVTEEVIPKETLPDYEKEPPDTWCDPIYPEYNRLDNVSKNLYAELMKGIEDWVLEYKFYGVEEQSVTDSFLAVMADNPEFFFINKYEGFMSDGEDEKGSFVTLEMIMSDNEGKSFENMKAELDDAVSKIVSEASKLSSDYDKALYVHDRLILNCEYDSEDPSLMYGAKNSQSTTAYGCIVNGKAICSGYSAAFQLIMQKLSIPCGMVSGIGINDGIGHGWNWILLDDEYYYVDLTWDDPVSSDSDNNIFHNYFCVTTDEILITQNIKEQKYFVPQCTATKYNYHIKNGFFIETYSFEAVEDLILKIENKEIFEIKFSSKEETAAAIKDLFDNKRIFEIQGLNLKSVQYFLSPSETIIRFHL